MADAGRGRRTVRRLLGAPPGHPARGRLYCRGRSPGSRVIAAVRPSRSRAGLSGIVGQRLAAHSCGGSAGIFTGFPLSSGSSANRRTSTTSIIGKASLPSTSQIMSQAGAETSAARMTVHHYR